MNNLIKSLLLLSLISYIPSAYANFSSDFDITLTHDGISVLLFSGDQDDEFGELDTIFDDDSINPVTGTPPFPFNMRPTDSLSSFNGSNLNGIWNLHIFDSFLPDEGDILVTWNIFGSLEDGSTFDITGPSAINIDTDPATIVSLSVSDLGLITDINVGITTASPVPVPAAVWLFASSLLGIFTIRKKHY